MPRFAFLAVLALFAAEASLPEVSRHPAVAVFMDFDSKRGDTSFAVMKKEAATTAFRKVYSRAIGQSFTGQQKRGRRQGSRALVTRCDS